MTVTEVLRPTSRRPPARRPLCGLGRYLAGLCVAVLVCMHAPLPQAAAEQPIAAERQEDVPLTDHHRRLGELVGEWYINASYLWQGGGQPEIFDGTASRVMILGGRVLEERVTMSNEDRIIQAVVHYGYDDIADEMWMTWMDNTMGGVAVFRGHYDADEDVTLLEGRISSPRLQGTFDREVESFVVDGSRHYVDFSGPLSPGGQRVRTRAIVYSRD